jgi:hypothetical protein
MKLPVYGEIQYLVNIKFKLFSFKCEKYKNLAVLI